VLKDPGSGLNRGYGFIKYKSKEVANAAMEKLNNTEIKDHPGHQVLFRCPFHAVGVLAQTTRRCSLPMQVSLLHSFALAAQIRVLPSQSKNRLYLGNLPKTISKEELEVQVRAATKGVLPGALQGPGVVQQTHEVERSGLTAWHRGALVGLLQAWKVWSCSCQRRSLARTVASAFWSSTTMPVPSTPRQRCRRPTSSMTFLSTASFNCPDIQSLTRPAVLWKTLPYFVKRCN
jgi:RNA recognition motif. (a.k.a. RRM, RBD, or RNP domain)